MRNSLRWLKNKLKSVFHESKKIDNVVVCQYDMDKADMLNNIIKVIQANGDNCYIWGVGDTGREILRWIKSLNLKIRGFIDSDAEKTRVDGVHVFRENVITINAFIIIASSASEEIINYLESKGLKKCINYYNCAETGVPVLYDDEISFSANVIKEIMDKSSEGMLGRPIPVALGGANIGSIGLAYVGIYTCIKFFWTN